MKTWGNGGTPLLVIQSVRYVCSTVLHICYRQQYHQRLHDRPSLWAGTSGKQIPEGDTALIDPNLRS